jgi:hypothetical protein
MQFHHPRRSKPGLSAVRSGRARRDLVDLAELKALAGDQQLNMTRLALN